MIADEQLAADRVQSAHFEVLVIDPPTRVVGADVWVEAQQAVDKGLVARDGAEVGLRRELHLDHVPKAVDRVAIVRILGRDVNDDGRDRVIDWEARTQLGLVVSLRRHAERGARAGSEVAQLGVQRDGDPLITRLEFGSAQDLVIVGIERGECRRR